jgi:hypothetical protein
MELACAFWRDVSIRKKEADRADMLNQVFAGISFSNVRIGALGRDATRERERKSTQPVWLLFKAARSLACHLADYPTLEREDQVRFLRDLEAAIITAPQEVRDHLAATLAAQPAE